MEPKGSLLCSQEPANATVVSQMSLVHTLPPYFPNIHFNIIFYTYAFRIPSNTSLNLRDQVLHPWETTGKVIVCTFLDRREIQKILKCMIASIPKI
jgi:hypothetical protein